MPDRLIDHWLATYPRLIAEKVEAYKSYSEKVAKDPTLVGNLKAEVEILRQQIRENGGDPDEVRAAFLCVWCFFWFASPVLCAFVFFCCAIGLFLIPQDEKKKAAEEYEKKSKEESKKEKGKEGEKE